MGQKDFEPADLIGVLRHLLSMSMLYNVYKNEWIKALDGHKKEDSHYAQWGRSYIFVQYKTEAFFQYSLFHGKVP